MVAMTAQLERLLKRADAAAGALTFAVIVPGWLDDPGVMRLIASPHVNFVVGGWGSSRRSLS